MDKQSFENLIQSSFEDEYHFENRIKQVGLDANQIISVTPKLFVNELFAQVDANLDDEWSLKLSKKYSSAHIDIESVVTHKVREFDCKIRQPYPNNKYVVAGLVENRKFNPHITFEPDVDEVIPYDYEKLDYYLQKLNIRYSPVFIYSDYIINRSTEYADYRRENDNVQLDSLHISEQDKEHNRFRFDDWLKHKYDVLPYNITETWHLVFEVKNGGRKYYIQMPKLEVKQSLVVLKYKQDYLKKYDVTYDDILIEAASFNRFLTVFDPSYTKLGLNYATEQFPIISVDLEADIINGELNIIHDYYRLEAFDPDIRDEYDVSQNIKGESFITMKQPNVVSMTPFLK